MKAKVNVLVKPHPYIFFTGIAGYSCYILVGRILLLVWDAHFHVGMSTLIVKTGKISLFALDAYFYSRIPIFT